MKENISIWLPPLLTLLGTLIFVIFTAWYTARAQLAAIGALEQKIESLRQEMRAAAALIRKEIAEFRAEVRVA